MINRILCRSPDSKNRGAAVIPAEDEVTIGRSPDETERDLKSTKDILLSNISSTLMDAR